MVSILEELFKAGKDIGREMKHRVFGRPKKEKTNKYSNTHVHFHFYREKKPRRKPPGLWG